MRSLIDFFTKKFSLSSFWVRNGLAVVIIAVVVNHLALPESFPLNESYKFPWLSILISIVLGSVIIGIAKLNFDYFKKKYFVEEINVRLLLRFLLSTLGYLSLFYSLFYLVVVAIVNGVEGYSIYYFLTGFFVTLLISVISIALLFAKELYQLYRFSSIEGKLKVEHGGKITLVNYNEIAFVYTENKIAYIVKTDGSSVYTDFTLNEIEDKINVHSFYRANRQTILHASAIEQVQAIENGKLSVRLKSDLSQERAQEINISRYKRQEFLNWFENKL
ncbi:LytR/AlgR family response regulator transcription factor [Flagellimonas meridianipacifica]|uniref:LytTr DNA-binding domain-containing protein n=1 Tax=Flagellimonas meridianipacifica TaxID=1080225 RepID=A0A2T0MJQ0_9FLAO|nr:LytTR family DNA-binding domain-containing protein [Allomuricauda pacifica]PRX57807.1 LytTr DNA-binding domain-containing protein [Allomuricauda pacifica]